MEIRSLDRMLAILATLAALTVAGMVVAILYTRGSQDFFQTARPVESLRRVPGNAFLLPSACGSISASIISS